MKKAIAIFILLLNFSCLFSQPHTYKFKWNYEKIIKAKVGDQPTIVWDNEKIKLGRCGRAIYENGYPSVVYLLGNEENGDYTYNNGLLISIKDSDKLYIECIYDEQNRLIQKTENHNTSFNTNSITIKYIYNEKNQIVSKTTISRDNEINVTKYQYNLDGNLEKEVDDSIFISYEYKNNKLVKKELFNTFYKTDPVEITTYGYDEKGLLQFEKEVKNYSEDYLSTKIIFYTYTLDEKVKTRKETCSQIDKNGISKNIVFFDEFLYWPDGQIKMKKSSTDSNPRIEEQYDEMGNIIYFHNFVTKSEYWYCNVYQNGLLDRVFQYLRF